MTHEENHQYPARPVPFLGLSTAFAAEKEVLEFFTVTARNQWPAAKVMRDLYDEFAVATRMAPSSSSLSCRKPRRDYQRTGCGRQLPGYGGRWPGSCPRRLLFRARYDLKPFIDENNTGCRRPELHRMMWMAISTLCTIRLRPVASGTTARYRPAGVKVEDITDWAASAAMEKRRTLNDIYGMPPSGLLHDDDRLWRRPRTAAS